MKPTVRSIAKYRGQRCLNCSTPLDVADKYCHQCGQLNTTKRLALKDFFKEFFASFISYDSRVWRTITHILIKPGYVTEQYCAGKRVQYANPFRFFLTVSIVFFLMLQVALQFSDSSIIKINPANNNGKIFNLSIDSTAADIDIKELAKAMRKQQDSLSKDQNVFENMAINSAIEAMELDSLNSKSEREYLTQKEIDDSNPFFTYFKQIENYGNYERENLPASTQEALKSLKHRVDDKNITRYKKAKKLNTYESDPVGLVNIILPKVPLFLFFFAPVMSLFFWLIYARGKWNYMEHMVFNFHLLTLIFIVLFVTVAEKSLVGTNFMAGLFFTILGPIYLYKAMRKFYKQGRFKTILKFMFINFVFLVLLFVTSVIFITGSIFASI